MELLQAHGKSSEHESAIMWFNQEKSKVESQLKDNKTDIANLDNVINDYFENSIKKEDTVTDALNKLFF